MEEFRQILRDAINVLRRPDVDINNVAFNILDGAYNTALDDVIKEVINRIPN